MASDQSRRRRSSPLLKALRAAARQRVVAPLERLTAWRRAVRAALTAGSPEAEELSRLLTSLVATGILGRLDQLDLPAEQAARPVTERAATLPQLWDLLFDAQRWNPASVELEVASARLAAAQSRLDAEHPRHPHSGPGAVDPSLLIHPFAHAAFPYHRVSGRWLSPPTLASTASPAGAAAQSAFPLMARSLDHFIGGLRHRSDDFLGYLVRNARVTLLEGSYAPLAMPLVALAGPQPGWIDGELESRTERPGLPPVAAAPRSPRRATAAGELIRPSPLLATARPSTAAAPALEPELAPPLAFVAPAVNRARPAQDWLPADRDELPRPAAERVRLVLDWTRGADPWRQPALVQSLQTIAGRLARRGIQLEIVRGQEVPAHRYDPGQAVAAAELSLASTAGPILLGAADALDRAIPIAQRPGFLRILVAPPVRGQPASRSALLASGAIDRAGGEHRTAETVPLVDRPLVRPLSRESREDTLLTEGHPRPRRPESERTVPVERITTTASLLTPSMVAPPSAFPGAASGIGPVQIRLDWVAGEDPWQDPERLERAEQGVRRLAARGVMIELQRGREVPSPLYLVAAARRASDFAVHGPAGPVLLAELDILDQATLQAQRPGFIQALIAPRSATPSPFGAPRRRLDEVPRDLPLVVAGATGRGGSETGDERFPTIAGQPTAGLGAVPREPARPTSRIEVILDWVEGQPPWRGDLPRAVAETVNRLEVRGIHLDLVRGQAVPAARYQASLPGPSAALGVTGPNGPVVLSELPLFEGAIPISQRPGQLRILLGPAPAPEAASAPARPVVPAPQLPARPDLAPVVAPGIAGQLRDLAVARRGDAVATGGRLGSPWLPHPPAGRRPLGGPSQSPALAIGTGVEATGFNRAASVAPPVSRRGGGAWRQAETLPAFAERIGFPLAVSFPGQEVPTRPASAAAVSQLPGRSLARIAVPGQLISRQVATAESSDPDRPGPVPPLHRPDLGILASLARRFGAPGQPDAEPRIGQISATGLDDAPLRASPLGGPPVPSGRQPAWSPPGWSAADLPPPATITGPASRRPETPPDTSEAIGGLARSIRVGWPERGKGTDEWPGSREAGQPLRGRASPWDTIVPGLLAYLAPRQQPPSSAAAASGLAPTTAREAIPAGRPGFPPPEPLGVLVLAVERSPFGPYPEIRIAPAVFQSPTVGAFSSTTSPSPAPSARTGAAPGATAGGASGAPRVDTTAPTRPPALPLRPKDVARATTDRPTAAPGPGPASPGQASTVVQAGAGSARPAPPPDVDALARQVYAAIKQRLAIEKERLGDSRTLRTW